MNAHPDPLERALCEVPHVDDAGFADGVMADLPPRRRSPRAAVLAGAAVLAAAFGAATLGDVVAGAALGIASSGAGVLLLAGACAAAVAGVLVRVR
jgi:hypothetical protein